MRVFSLLIISFLFIFDFHHVFGSPATKLKTTFSSLNGAGLRSRSKSPQNDEDADMSTKAESVSGESSYSKFSTFSDQTRRAQRQQPAENSYWLLPENGIRLGHEQHVYFILDSKKLMKMDAQELNRKISLYVERPAFWRNHKMRARAEEFTVSGEHLIRQDALKPDEFVLRKIDIGTGMNDLGIETVPARELLRIHRWLNHVHVKDDQFPKFVYQLSLNIKDSPYYFFTDFVRLVLLPSRRAQLHPGIIYPRSNLARSPLIEIRTFDDSIERFESYAERFSQCAQCVKKGCVLARECSRSLKELKEGPDVKSLPSAADRDEEEARRLLRAEMSNRSGARSSASFRKPGRQREIDEAAERLRQRFQHSEDGLEENDVNEARMNSAAFWMNNAASLWNRMQSSTVSQPRRAPEVIIEELPNDEPAPRPKTVKKSKKKPVLVSTEDVENFVSSLEKKLKKGSVADEERDSLSQSIRELKIREDISSELKKRLKKLERSLKQ